MRQALQKTAKAYALLLRDRDTALTGATNVDWLMWALLDLADALTPNGGLPIEAMAHTASALDKATREGRIRAYLDRYALCTDGMQTHGNWRARPRVTGATAVGAPRAQSASQSRPEHGGPDLRAYRRAPYRGSAEGLRLGGATPIHTCTLSMPSLNLEVTLPPNAREGQGFTVELVGAATEASKPGQPAAPRHDGFTCFEVQRYDGALRSLDVKDGVLSCRVTPTRGLFELFFKDENGKPHFWVRSASLDGVPFMRVDDDALPIAKRMCLRQF
jgi:hypothetical protein